jgi:hypothetical protein
MNAPAPSDRSPAWVTLGIVVVIGLACFNMAFVLREGLAIGTPLVFDVGVFLAVLGTILNLILALEED